MRTHLTSFIPTWNFCKRNSSTLKFQSTHWDILEKVMKILGTHLIHRSREENFGNPTHQPASQLGTFDNGLKNLAISSQSLWSLLENFGEENSSSRIPTLKFWKRSWKFCENISYADPDTKILGTQLILLDSISEILVNTLWDFRNGIKKMCARYSRSFIPKRKFCELTSTDWYQPQKFWNEINSRSDSHVVGDPM